MAKRFFYDKVYSKKKLIIDFIIIAICIIGIISCFIFTSHFQGQNNNFGQLDLKNETFVEMSEPFDKSIFFINIENTNLDKVEIKYPDNYNIKEPGKYNVLVNIAGTDYEVTLNVVDTEKPKLELKELIINENESYSPYDFVKSCVDNSEKKCIIEFNGDSVNEDGEQIIYSSYKKAGSYPIKISAKDESGNMIVKETTLIINKKSNSIVPISPSTCKYGNDTYDNEKYLMAVKIATNGCAINPATWKDAGKTELDQITKTEITKIQKELKEITGTPAITRKIITILNETNTGIVGFELKMIVTVTNDDKTETILEYKLDEDGNRIYENNKNI